MKKFVCYHGHTWNGYGPYKTRVEGAPPAALTRFDFIYKLPLWWKKRVQLLSQRRFGVVSWRLNNKMLNKATLLCAASMIEALTLDNLKEPEIGFNMGDWGGHTTYVDTSGNRCNTVACIAGFIVLAAGYSARDLCKMQPQEIRSAAAQLAGLDEGEATRLFYALWRPIFGKDLCDIKPLEAATAIRRLVRTGTCLNGKLT